MVEIPKLLPNLRKSHGNLWPSPRSLPQQLICGLAFGMDFFPLQEMRLTYANIQPCNDLIIDYWLITPIIDY